MIKLLACPHLRYLTALQHLKAFQVCFCQQGTIQSRTSQLNLEKPTQDTSKFQALYTLADDPKHQLLRSRPCDAASNSKEIRARVMRLRQG